MISNKEKILEAASTLFLQGGTAALSVRAIAKLAGISTIGIYSHFEGKQGILDALYIEGFERVDTAMGVLDLGLTSREAMTLAVNNYFDLAQAYPAHYSLVFGDTDAGYEPTEEARLTGAAAFSKLIALAATVLPADATTAHQQRLAMRIWAVMHGAVSLQKHAVAELIDMTQWREDILEAVLILVDGLSTQSSV